MVAEVTTFVAVMKALGIETGRIIESLFIVFVVLVFLFYIGAKHLWPMLKKFLASMDEMKSSVTDLNKTLQEHIIQTDLRMSEGEERFVRIESQIKYLNDQLGSKATTHLPHN